MERCIYVEIAGKQYPMSFSLGATKKIIGRFGSLKNNNEEVKKEEELKEDMERDGLEALETISFILEILIAQGCAYKNYFEKDLPAPVNAPIENGSWTPIPKEMLDIAIQITDTKEIVEKISECVKQGSKKKIEAKANGKNQKAAQG